MSGPQSNITGPIRAVQGESDGQVFIPASRFNFSAGVWTPTRSAAGDYFLRKTAAAATDFAWVSLLDCIMEKIGADPMTDFGVDGISPGNPPGAVGHQFRGVQISGIDVVYNIGTADLTSLVAKILSALYAQGAAPVITDNSALFTGAGALPVVDTVGEPSVVTLPCTAPYVLGGNNADQAEWFELAVDDPGTSVFDLYGIFVHFNYNLL